MAYPMMTSLWIVGPMYYGCYSCRDRQYDAASRSSSYSVGAPQDRYEFEEAPFNTPSLDAAEWPLTLHLHNFTTFTPSGTVPLGKVFHHPHNIRWRHLGDSRDLPTHSWIRPPCDCLALRMLPHVGALWVR